MAAASSPKIVTNGMVLFLDAFNSKSYPGTGNIWYDLSGNGYHFSLINSPTFNSGEGSFSFVNSSSQTAKYTSFPFPFSFGSFTLGMFVYYSPSTTNDGILWCANGGGFNSGATGLESRFRGTARLEYTVNDGISTGIRLQSDLPGGWGSRWSMIWVRHAAQSTATLYDRAIPITTQSYTGEVASSLTSDFYIGRGFDTFFNGKISSFYLYNRVLTEDEILLNYNSVKGRFGL